MDKSTAKERESGTRRELYALVRGVSDGAGKITPECVADVFGDLGEAYGRLKALTGVNAGGINSAAVSSGGAEKDGTETLRPRWEFFGISEKEHAVTPWLPANDAEAEGNASRVYRIQLIWLSFGNAK